MISKDKIIEYDYVRALVMIFVILGHCTYTSISSSYGGVIVPLDNDLSIIGKALTFVSIIIYSFHMPLFMALSGCVWALVIKKKGLPTFSFLIKSKIRRLLIPFLFTSVFWSIPLKYFSGYWSGSFSEIIEQVFWGQIMMRGNANSHLWFLQALFWIFLFSFFIEKYNLRKNKVLFISLILCVFIIGKLVGEYRLLNIPNACVNMIWFYFGFVFEKNREYFNERIKHLRNNYLILCSFCYPILVLGKWILPDVYVLDLIYYFLLAIWGICLVYAICVKICMITPLYAIIKLNG